MQFNSFTSQFGDKGYLLLLAWRMVAELWVILFEAENKQMIKTLFV